MDPRANGPSHLKSAVRAVSHIALSLGSFTRLEDLLQSALERVLEVMETEAGAVHLLDDRTRELRLVAQIGMTDAVIADADRYALGEGLPGWVTMTGDPVVLDDATTDARVTRRMARAEGYRGFAAVPLKTPLRTYGAIQVVTHEQRTFGQDDVDLLRAIGTQIGLGIENARLVLELRQKVETESLLHRVSAALNAGARWTDTIRLVAESLGTTLGVTHCLVTLRGPGVRKLRYEYAAASVASIENRAIPAELFTTLERRRTVWAISDVAESELSERTRNALMQQGRRACLLAPLVSDPRVVGLLMLDDQTRREWQVYEIALVQAVANQTALALDRARLEQNLRASERQFRDLVEAALDLIFQVDRHGRIVYVNPAVTALLGFDAEEVYGASPWAFTFVHPEDRERLQEHFSRVLAGETPHSLEYRLQDRNGETVRWVSQNSSLLRAPAGRVRGVLAFVRDMTEARRLQQQILEAARFADLGRLAARIAHEIRNPLGAIINCIEVLKKDAGARTDPRLVKVTTEEAEHLNRILSDLLAFARPSEREDDRFHLEEVIEDTLRLFQQHPSARPEVTVEFRRTGLAPPVCGDRQQIRQILWNLLTNALEATPGAGRILVLLEPVVVAGRATAVLRVSDHGAGVPPEIREQIFEPFFTTKASGSGLGLSIVDRLVREHGGSVELETPDGGGATFSVMMPAAM